MKDGIHCRLFYMENVAGRKNCRKTTNNFPGNKADPHFLKRAKRDK